MTTMTLAEKAAAFVALHDAPEILVLPNCWDRGSARILAGAGFPAIATTSAGIAFAAGVPDGHRLSRAEMCAAVKQCADIIDIPLTADMEAGYGDAPEDVAQSVRQAIEAGAVGANIEDAIEGEEEPMLDITLATDRIRAGREASDALGVPFVLNARTDIYLLNKGATPAMFDETVARANAYAAAGARCVYVPGVADPDLIARLVAAIEGPLNILAGPKSLPTATLQEMGVARVSIGGSLSRACLSLVDAAATELRGPGTYGYCDGAISNDDMNRRFGG